jgi:uncharacterized protein Yka (UPF0111/DUF47 family)
MFEHLRNVDDEVFRQFALVCQRLVQSARLLEQLLAGTSADEARLGRAIHEADEDAHRLAHAADARALTAFVMRLDRMDVHAVAVALDAAVSGVEDAASQAEALHARGAPPALRSLAATLTRAAEALETATAHVGRSPQGMAGAVTEVRRFENEGEAYFDDGVGRLFVGTPDVLEVLRWKDTYERVLRALAQCALAAGTLEQISQHDM